MPLVAGVDGCPAGWICITRDTLTGLIDSEVFPNANELIHQTPEPAILMVDLPVGLPAAGARLCGLQARQRIGQRRSSVFPAPIRPALGAATRAQACQITHAADGRRVGCQAWGIFPKVSDIDATLQAQANLQT